jgi:rod shape-determining protein MreC
VPEAVPTGFFVSFGEAVGYVITPSPTVSSRKRFDQARPFATLGIALAVWLVVPAGLRGFLRASFFEFQAPLEFTASHIRDLQSYWGLRLHSEDELIEAGRDQGRLIANYEALAQSNTQLRAELSRWEAELRIPARPGFRPEAARVASRVQSGWWQQIVIRKGRNYGLLVNSPVIFSGGLVGIVREVRAYESVVELISNPSFRLAGSVEGDHRPITYVGGTNAAFAQPRGRIESVPLDIYASDTTPKQLVTSGLGGTYPPGLTIGRIIRIEPTHDGVYSEGEVQLDPRLNALSEVTVLVPLDPANP